VTRNVGVFVHGAPLIGDTKQDGMKGVNIMVKKDMVVKIQYDHKTKIIDRDYDDEMMIGI
jgi:hypothetical protein